jgi:hypothetical protein
VALDFRGHPLPPELEPFGPLDDHYVKVEPEGLRVTLPRERTNPDAVGWNLPVTVAGDFTITAGVEILQAEEPPFGAKSYGVGVLLSVNESGRVGRLVRAGGNQIITWDRWEPVPGAHSIFRMGAAPCAATTLRLRLQRTDTVLHFLWAPEAAGEEFVEFYQCEFGSHDISRVRLELNSNLGRGQAAALDARLLDLEVRAANATVDRAATGTGDGPSRRSGWLAAATILGGGTLLALAAYLVVRRRRHTKREKGGAAGPAPAPVSVRCSGCGTTFKGKPELAGKRVKCPKCGQALAVPAPTAES